MIRNCWEIEKSCGDQKKGSTKKKHRNKVLLHWFFKAHSLAKEQEIKIYISESNHFLVVFLWGIFLTKKIEVSTPNDYFESLSLSLLIRTFCRFNGWISSSIFLSNVSPNRRRFKKWFKLFFSLSGRERIES